MNVWSMATLVMTCGFAAYAQKSVYLDEIKRSAEKGWRENTAIVEQWKKTTKPSVLWGYDAPAHPIYLAGTLAFLYELTGEKEYADRAAILLSTYGDLRDVLPKEYAATRAEYSSGVPSLSNFFFLPPYARAYMRIRNALSGEQRAKIERELAGSVEFVFRFPEWGAHNRAMLRAEALLYAAQALPDNPRAKVWRQMAGNIAADNLGQWEIEDASNYSPVWLHALFSYAEAAGRTDVFSSAVTRYYLDYFSRLIGPNGSVPDFGDGVWNSASAGLRLVAFFERGASAFKNPEWKWAAATILASVRRSAETISVGDAYHLSDAFRWADESVPRVAPTSLSQEVLDDVIGKKVVFRNGWDSLSTYLLLNYRDEGDGGTLDRDYLRATISVEEEKMHHGHSDENSVVMLMDRGSLLLHDAGYRDGLPSGRYGAWRQDYFHNRIVARHNKRDQAQSVMEFVRNSGAYRAVRTNGIDFLSARDADMSRTRLVDEQLGYRWDRTVIYVRDPGYFVVIDGITVLRQDYFTFTNFWHARDLLGRGSHFYDIATDSLPGFRFSRQRALCVYFPETYAKHDSVEPIQRHGQTEHAIYQTISSQYKSGDMEVFVTLLIPHDRTTGAETLIPRVRMIPVSTPGRAVALESTLGGITSVAFVRLDLERELAKDNIRPRYQYDLGKVAFGEFETDGYFLFARREGSAFRYSCSNFLKVMHRGKEVVGALPNTHSLQLDGSPPRIGFSKWRFWEGEVPVGK